MSVLVRSYPSVALSGLLGAGAGTPEPAEFSMAIRALNDAKRKDADFEDQASTRTSFLKIEASEAPRRTTDLLLMSWLFESSPERHSIRNIQGLRERTVFSFDRQKRIQLEYENPARLRQRLSELKSSLSMNGFDGWLRKPIFAFGFLIGVHPFMDGNGRLCRIFLTQLLRRNQLWDGQELPIAFLAYRDRDQFVRVTQDLLVNHDYRRFETYVARLIGAAAELHRLTRSRSCGLV